MKKITLFLTVLVLLSGCVTIIKHQAKRKSCNYINKYTPKKIKHQFK
jgi:uncharacterized protein YceK